MAAVYQFLGVEPFAHDFTNVKFEADEFDRISGTPGLHSVAREVRYVARPTILPGEIFRKFDKPSSFWNEPTKNLRNVRIVWPIGSAWTLRMSESLKFDVEGWCRF